MGNLRRISLIALSLFVLGASAVASAESKRQSTLEDEGFASHSALLATYKDACRGCHARRWSKAPRQGVKEHWQPRLKKGMPELVSNVKNGLGRMPAMGRCKACTDRQFEQLVEHIARF